MAKVVEHLPSKHKALSVNPSAREREREREEIWWTTISQETPCDSQAFLPVAPSSRKGGSHKETICLILERR
jgi:hypothetical protein